MNLQEGVEINVVQARWLKEHVLQIDFSDGCSKNVDFGPFLSASDQPEIRKYMEVERFKGFSVCYGNLVWNDYDLCFSIEDIYSGRLVAGQEPDTMVAEDSSGYGQDEKDRH